MNRACRRAAVALALCATPVAAAGPYAPPEPDVLSALEHHHSTHDWWRITLDSARWEVRVRTVDASGLSGFQPRKKGTPVPAAIAWSEISRIDERKSHFRKKQVEGVILGSIAGSTLAALGGLQDPLPGFALFAGAGLGGWLGALYGDGQVHEQPVYISRTLFVAPPAVAAATVSDSSADSVSTAAALDSTVAGGAGPGTLAPASGAAATAAAAVAPAKPDSHVLEACRRIHPSSVVRVHADFGLFEGNVEHAGPEGLSGLRLASVGGAGAAAMPDLVRWERIDRVELRGNHARTGAIVGAILGCGLGALVGLVAVVAVAQSGSSDGGGTWILAGAAAGAGGCALVGAGFGSLGTTWKPIYAR